MLKPQDIVVLAKLVAIEDPKVPIHGLARALSMSPSEVHHAIHRASDAGLVKVVEHRTHAHEKHVKREALLELVLSGLKYVFPETPQTHARGVPTGWAAPVLLTPDAPEGTLPPVWPTEDGPVAGLEVKPLYRCVPQVACRDPKFYALMASIDAIRTRCPRATRAARTTLAALLTEPPTIEAGSVRLSAPLRDPAPALETSACPAG